MKNMDNEYMEFSEKSLDDCITVACRKLAVTSENLDYEVVDQGSTGFMGFNSRNAVIKARVRGNAHGVAAASGDVLGNVHASSYEEKSGSSDSIEPSEGSRMETSSSEPYAAEYQNNGYDEAKADTSSYNRSYSGSDFTRSSGRSSRSTYGSSHGSYYDRNGRSGQKSNRSRVDRTERDRSDTERSYGNSYGDSYGRSRKGSYGDRNNRGYHSDRDYSGRSGRRDRYERSEVEVDYTQAYAAAAAAAAAAQKKPEVPKVNYTEEQIAEFKARADAFLNSMFQAMGMEVEISYEFDPAENILTVDFEGEEMGVLIGKRGQTLDSIQYLISLVVNKGIPGYVHVKADTEDYRARRRKTLENLARNMASKVKRTHRAQALEPMNPYERRIIHSALQGDRYVTTYSEGEDPYRRVVIIPREGQ